MAFPKRLLTEGEDLVLDLRPHWIALVFPVATTILIVGGAIAALVYKPDSWPGWTTWAIVLIALLLFVLFPLRRIIRWLTSHFVVTTDRVINRTGWFAKQSMEIPLENLNDVRFHQGVFERIIGAGDLIIESAGEHGQETFADVRDPEHVQKTIYEMGELNQREMVRGGPSSTADELAKLNQRRQEGVISEGEFQAQKAKLLGPGG